MDERRVIAVMENNELTLDCLVAEAQALLSKLQEVMLNSYYQEQERKLVDIPCFSCGKLVEVWIPFYGCIYCSDCSLDKSFNESATTEDFKRGL